MKGRFNCVFTELTYAVVIAGMIVVLITVSGATKGDLTAAAVLFAVMGIVLPLGFALGNIPCTYTADNEGFTITVLRKSHSYRYDELESVTCEYGRADRYGNAYVDLTVKTRRGGTDLYTENCGMKMHDIMNDPKCEKPQLIRLCEYVNKEMGALS